jgi:hypothetical protein
MLVVFDVKAKGCYGPRAESALWQRALCKVGVHVYGEFELSRFNPSLNMSAYHRYCACGLSKSKLVWHRKDSETP